MSSSPSRPSVLILKGLALAWIALCCGSLIWTLMSLGSIDAALGPTARSQLQGEAIMGLALLMNILTFPVGLLMTPLIGAVSSTVHSVFGTPGGNVLYVELFVIWLAFVVVGYVQWFALLPWGVRKWKERRLEQSSAQQ